jgi:uncharacterized protein (TIGR02246 family)
MLSRTSRTIAKPLALLIMAGAVTGLSWWGGLRLARAQVSTKTKSQSKPQPPPAAQPKASAAAATKPSTADEEKAIRAVDEEFVREYNKGDSKALAARFTEDAEAVEVDGTRYEGRDLIEKRFAEMFEASPGVKISLEIGAIRFLSADVAKEEGHTVVTPWKGVPDSSFYTVLYVKRDGRWLISSVREEPDPVVRPHERLKELEWMIGDWVDEGSDSEVRVNCRWSEDENFLMRSFTVKRQGKPVMSVTQRIGWDPVARQIRSWEFDSEGGFGEGRWSHDGERWVVKHSGVRPEGTTASATNITLRTRPDLVRWVSTDRVIGDESLSDDEAYVLVRVPPAPATHSKGEAAPAPSPNTPRSPQ